MQLLLGQGTPGSMGTYAMLQRSSPPERYDHAPYGLYWKKIACSIRRGFGCGRCDALTSPYATIVEFVSFALLVMSGWFYPNQIYREVVAARPGAAMRQSGPAQRQR